MSLHLGRTEFGNKANQGNVFTQEEAMQIFKRLGCLTQN
jgi:hypothetical protein